MANLKQYDVYVNGLGQIVERECPTGKWIKFADIIEGVQKQSGEAPSQQLKPKMPSFVEFDEWCRDNLCATRRDIYDYMARHFGH
jgi:hypothetical protein